MGNEKPRRAARAHEQAQDAVAAARAARERSEHIRLEMGLRRRRTDSGPVEIDPASEAVLRAHLQRPPRGRGTPTTSGC